MEINRSVLGLLLAIFVVQLTLNDAAVFKLTNAVCESLNKSWVAINECRLKAINRNKTTFNFNATFYYPAYRITQVVNLFKKANGYKPWVVKGFHIDVCRFLKKPYHPYGILMNNLILQYSNLNHSCPFVGEQLVQGFHVLPESMGLPYPSGDYLMTMDWIFNKNKQFVTNMYYRITESLIDM